MPSGTISTTSSYPDIPLLRRPLEELDGEVGFGLAAIVVADTFSFPYLILRSYGGPRFHHRR